jgi:hypothetical protein
MDTQLTQAEQIEMQRKFLAEQPKEVGLAEDRYLIQSMRSTRYSDEAHAWADIVDNSIESGATRVEIIYNTDSGGKILDIAIVDNGCGMLPEMLKHAVRWGGSTRYGSRNLFGRFGFGLPSASLKHGTKYSVISRTVTTDNFYSVTIDFIDILKLEGRVKAPEPVVSELPEWLKSALSDGSKFPLNDVKTVIILSDRDSLKWKTAKTSAAETLNHFGVVYASYLNSCSIAVNGAIVEPVDPLFLTPTAKWYKLYNNGVETKVVDHSIPSVSIRDKNGNWQEVKIRVSYFDVASWVADEDADGKKVGTKRRDIKKHYNGVLVYRNGRFIELNRAGMVWQNYTRQVGVAIDFPAELDDLFGITPDKQTVIFDEVIQDQLFKQARLKQVIKDLEGQVKLERAKKEQEELIGNGENGRASERVAAKLDKIQTRGPKSEETAREAEQNKQRLIKEKAAISGLPESVVAAHYEETEERLRVSFPYKIEFFEGRSGEPFYEPEPVGSQIKIKINVRHPFYTEFYGLLLNKDPFAQAGIELLLTIMSRAEVDASGESRAFYMEERNKWSHSLGQGLHMLPSELTKAESSVTADELLSVRNTWQDLEEN